MTAVLVIGAGISGLSAARALMSSGYDVKVIEARSRAGGRIWTDNSLGVPIDLGASWIHGKKSNPIYELAKQFTIRTVSSNQTDHALFSPTGKLISRTAEHHQSERPQRALDSLRGLAAKLHEDISVADGVRRVVADETFSDDERCYLNMWLSEFEVLNAAPLSEQSLRGLVAYQDGSHGGDLVFPSGYGSLVERLAADVNVLYDEPVLRILQDDRNVSVHTAKAAHVADAAIITLPLGVLKAGAVEFEPALPERKTAAIKSLKMGLLNKVALRFAEPFWPKDRDFVEFTQNEPGAFHSFLNVFKYTGQPALLGFAGGASAATLEKLSDHEVVQSALAVLRRLPDAASVVPVDARVTRWGQDPYSRGSYSVVSVGADSQPFSNLAETVGRLYFAGEATNLTHQGTVHGAYLSGLRAAENLAKSNRQ